MCLSITRVLTTPPSDKGPSCPQLFGNPIDSAGGLKIQSAIDYSTEGANRLTLERFYVSDASYMAGDFSWSRVGANWRTTNFDALALYVDVASNSSKVYLVLPNWQWFRFGNSNGTFIQQYFDWASKTWTDGSQGEHATLVQDATASRFVLTTSDDTIWSFDYNGKLRTKTSRDGYVQTLDGVVEAVDT